VELNNLPDTLLPDGEKQLVVYGFFPVTEQV